MVNDEAFDRLSLYLMERYRRLGQTADANRVRNTLMTNRGTDAEIKQRVAYYDVAAHLLTLHPGQRPSSADSTALVTVAGSSSGFAPVACATLRYYYPKSSCKGSSSSNNNAVPRAAVRKSPAGRVAAIKLQAYPTPSRDQVTIEWGPTPGTAPARLEVRDVATGRLVRSQAVADAATVRLSVAELAPGLYVSRLLDAAGQVLGTGKVVVIR